MQAINIYDYEAEKIEEWAEKYGVGVADIVEALVDHINCGDIDLSEDFTI